MAILKRIHIKNFKSILAVDAEFGQLNIFVGCNGAGKSNILEAIGLLSAAVSGEIDYPRLSERGVRLSSPEVFRSAFKNNPRKSTFYLEGESDDLRYAVSVSTNKDPASRLPWGYHSEKLVRTKTGAHLAGRSNAGNSICVTNQEGIQEQFNVKIKKQNGIIKSAEALGALTDKEIATIEAFRNFAIYSPSTPILRGMSPDTSVKIPVGLYGGGIAEALSELVKDKNIEELLRFFRLLDWFESIGTTVPDEHLQSAFVQTGKRVVSFREKYMQRNFKNLYAYDVSEGALYILFALILLTHKKSPTIFALDNIDNALNPGLVTSLIGHIAEITNKDSNKQLFLTTHNPTTLDAVNLFNPTHKLYVIERNSENGATEMRHISPPPNMTQQDWSKKYGGMKLSEIWLSGGLGGLNPPKSFI